ncbi:MAG: hypothetical protein JOS17DRAFT_821216 [Linnemannia elongata]|nr:MAG: hypothetical protein JOS17DRAFT_821216 [Linnemannia elongata]
MTIHKCQLLTLRKAVKLRGLLNVKHAIQTRLTKESEDAKTVIDDKIDELEERIADGSRTEVKGLDDRREIGVVERWEDIRIVPEWLTALLVQSDDKASNQMWKSDTSNATSVSGSDLSSLYESDVESVSRVPQKYEPSSASEFSEVGESDRSPDSYNEAPSEDGSSDIVETQQEEPAIGKTLSGTGFSTICSEKRKHYGASDSGSDESDGPTGSMRSSTVPAGQVMRRRPFLSRSRKRIREGSSGDGNEALELELLNMK